METEPQESESKFTDLVKGRTGISIAALLLSIPRVLSPMPGMANRFPSLSCADSSEVEHGLP